MTDHDRQRTAFGLDALTHAIHNIGIDQGKVATQQFRIVVRGQAGPSPGQKFPGGMTAGVDQGIRLELFPQPVVEADVLMSRRKGGVGVQQLLVHFPPTRRLGPDENIAKPEPRKNHLTVHHHGLAGRLAPAGKAGKTGSQQRIPRGIHFASAAAFIQPTLPACLIVVQQCHRLLPRRVLMILQQVMQVPGAAVQQSQGNVMFTGGKGFFQALVQVAQGAMLHFRPHHSRQALVIGPVFRPRQGSNLGRHLAQGAGIVRQAHAALLDQLQQRL